MKHKKIRKKITVRDILFQFINIMVFVLFAVVCIYPFYYVFINSISNNAKVAVGAVRFWPQGIHFDNYVSAFQIKGIGRAAFISLARTILGTFAMLLSTSILGYAMTKQEFWCRKFWYRFLVATMYFSAGVIPGYLNIKRLGLLDNFWVYVLPAFVAPYNLILFKTYVESIPQSLEEAALMDGAGYTKRFLQVVLPLSKPIIATVSIFTAVGQWSSFMDTVLYMSNNDYRTLQSLLYQYLSRIELLSDMLKKSQSASEREMLLASANPAAIRYTVTCITIFPVMLFYPFFQRYFIKGIMIGAVKG